MLELHILLETSLNTHMLQLQTWEQDSKVSLYTSHSLSRRAEESNKSPYKKEREKEKEKDTRGSSTGEKGEEPTPVRDRTPAYHRTLGQERTAQKHEIRAEQKDEKER